MAPSALPLPTGGVTNVLELITMALALELIAGRREIWLPARWRRLKLEPAARPDFVAALLRRIRWLERRSRPRLAPVVRHRLAGVMFGALVFVLCLTAFLAPPFTGLDTLPSMGVVVLSLGVLLEDAALVLAGVVVGALGVVVMVGLGSLIVEGLQQLL
jgi:hypothetical protein